MNIQNRLRQICEGTAGQLQINTNANVFSFTYPDVDANMFYYKYFSNDKIVITGKKLSWPSENSVFVMK